MEKSNGVVTQILQPLFWDSRSHNGSSGPDASPDAVQMFQCFMELGPRTTQRCHAPSARYTSQNVTTTTDPTVLNGPPDRMQQFHLERTRP